MRVDELVGSIQTYEMTLLSSQKPKDSTFKAYENEEKDIEMPYNIARDEFTQMDKRIKKVMKFNKRFKKKIKNLEKAKRHNKQYPKKRLNIPSKVRKLNALTTED